MNRELASLLLSKEELGIVSFALRTYRRKLERNLEKPELGPELREKLNLKLDLANASLSTLRNAERQFTKTS